MSEILRLKVKDLLNDDVLRKVYVVVSKTKSVFNRGLNESQEIKKALASYLKENPEIGEYPLKILPNFPNAYYNFVKKEFVLGLFNSSIISHELEHLLSVADSPNYQTLLEKSRSLSNLSSRFALPVAVGGTIKVHAPETTPAINKLYDILSVTHGLASLPTLYEEGKANIKAIAKAPDSWESMKTLLPAYGSYVSNTSFPIGFYQLAKHINKVKD